MLNISSAPLAEIPEDPMEDTTEEWTDEIPIEQTIISQSSLLNQIYDSTITQLDIGGHLHTKLTHLLAVLSTSPSTRQTFFTSWYTRIVMATISRPTIAILDFLLMNKSISTDELISGKHISTQTTGRPLDEYTFYAAVYDYDRLIGLYSAFDVLFSHKCRRYNVSTTQYNPETHSIPTRFRDLIASFVYNHREDAVGTNVEPPNIGYWTSVCVKSEDPFDEYSSKPCPLNSTIGLLHHRYKCSPPTDHPHLLDPANRYENIDARNDMLEHLNGIIVDTAREALVMKCVIEMTNRIQEAVKADVNFYTNYHFYKSARVNDDDDQRWWTTIPMLNAVTPKPRPYHGRPPESTVPFDPASVDHGFNRGLDKIAEFIDSVTDYQFNFVSTHTQLVSTNINACLANFDSPVWF